MAFSFFIAASRHFCSAIIPIGNGRVKKISPNLQNASDVSHRTHIPAVTARDNQRRSANQISPDALLSAKLRIFIFATTPQLLFATPVQSGITGVARAWKD